MAVSWVEAMRDVGGRLVPAALNFMEAQGSALPDAGATGVQWLADRIERFLEQEEDTTEDDRFVEGAGAVLGLLLIEHLGGRTRERDGTHRVQLGRFGWFDPFDAIEQALDAEDPRHCLSEYLTIAEREARQAGPVSRIVSTFAEVLGEHRPDVRIEAQFELTVELDNGATVDLARLEKVAHDQDQGAIAEAARRIVSMLPGDEGPHETQWAEAEARLFPRLVSNKFLGSLPNDDALYREEVGHDVHLTLQLRYGPRARYVRRTEVEQWLDNGDAFHQAIRNLASHSRELRLEPIEDGLLRVRQGDGLDAARLVLPDLAVRLRRLSTGSWIAAAPHRDVLLVAPIDGAPLLAKHASDAAERAPHPISSALFSVTEEGLFPVHP
ncbi:MAG: DUF1444 family protein [Deltaproteobacteria bacterium]|nr:DUF1444 family protein [Deltaproteobacteria bacterium]